MIVDALKKGIEENRSQDSLEQVIRDVLRDNKAKKTAQPIVIEDGEDETNDIDKEGKDRKNGKRSKAINLKMTLEDYETLIAGLGYHGEQKEQLIANFKEANKEYFDKLEREKKAQEQFEHDWTEALLEEEAIRLEEERIKAELTHQKKQEEEKEGLKNQQENSALRVADMLVEAFNNVAAKFDKVSFDQASYEEKVTIAKNFIYKKGAIKKVYVAHYHSLSTYDFVAIVKETWKELNKIEQYVIRSLEQEVQKLQNVEKELITNKSVVEKEKKETMKSVEKAEGFDAKINAQYLTYICDKAYLTALEVMKKERDIAEEKAEEEEKDIKKNSVYITADRKGNIITIENPNRKLKRKSTISVKDMINIDAAFTLEQPIIKKVIIENEILSYSEIQTIIRNVQNNTAFYNYCSFDLSLNSSGKGSVIDCKIYGVLPKQQLETLLKNYQQKESSGKTKLENLYNRKDELVQNVDDLLEEKFPNATTVEECVDAWDSKIKSVKDKIKDNREVLDKYIALKNEVNKLIEDTNQL